MLKPVSLASIHVPAVEGPQFVQGWRGLPSHPLGPGYACPESVVWVTALVQG
jgi:hypothetical protein